MKINILRLACFIVLMLPFFARIVLPVFSVEIPTTSEEKTVNKETSPTIEETKGYIGMWVTANGYIRHELLSGNRYDEARGDSKSAYQGSYKVTGNHIDYKDDTRFTAEGDFINGVLHHAGMILYKEEY